MSYAEWSPYTVYLLNDIVNYSGAEYQALQTNQNVVPSTLAPNWVIYAPGGSGLNIVSNDTNATFFPTFVSGVGAGVSTLNIDSATTPFSFNPNNGNIALATTLKIDGDKAAFGQNAGLFSQGAGAIAIGQNAGAGFSVGVAGQGTGAIAIGVEAGQGFDLSNFQQTKSIAIGFQAGKKNQGTSSIAVGDGAGNNQQNASIAIGLNAANTGAIQGSGAVAIGELAGNSSQGASTVAIGQNCGSTSQGARSVAIGVDAGRGTVLSPQGTSAIAIGDAAGFPGQGTSAIAIGQLAAGMNPQGSGSIAIGVAAGRGIVLSQGSNAIAIGTNAGSTIANASSIILNGSGNDLPATAAGFFVDPIRPITHPYTLCYDPANREITYADKIFLNAGFIGTITAQTYASLDVLFGSNIGPGFLSPLSFSPSLTNSLVPTPNGWISTTGQFYSPTETTYTIIITLFGSTTAGGNVFFERFNGGNVLQERRLAGFSLTAVSPTFRQYSTILTMNAGDYFQVIVDDAPTLLYDSPTQFTFLQVREL